MRDDDKTREQLLDELTALRRQVDDLVSSKEKLKQSQDALQESESRYRRLFDHAGDAIFLSERFNVLDCNKRAQLMFRCSKEQLKQVMSFSNVFSPRIQPDGMDSKIKALQKIHAALNGEPQFFEWRYRRADGTQFDAEVTINRIILEGRQVLLSIIRDVTARKKAEHELTQSRRMFQELVESSLSGILIIQDDTLVYANPELKRLFGPIPPAFRLIDYDGIYLEDIEKVRALHQSVESGETRMNEMILRFYPIGKTGSKHDLKVVFCRASRITYEGKEVVLFNMMDITRARELEQLLHAKDKMTSLGRVAAGIAHEIRNPLSGINIHVRSLEKIAGKSVPATELTEILREIRTASDKIEAVIRRVMDFVKPGQPILVLADINRPVADALDLSSAAVRKKGITMTKNLSAELPPCYIEPHLIEQVIMNLITNAAEAITSISPTGTIAVSTARDNDAIVIRVEDSGPGVAEHERSKIFDPFYTTRSDGAGIGLSISSRIINDHGGSIHVEAGAGGGALFTIKLPVPE